MFALFTQNNRINSKMAATTNEPANGVVTCGGTGARSGAADTGDSSPGRSPGSPSDVHSTTSAVTVAATPTNNNYTIESGQIRFSGHTLDKATKAKVHLENYYSNLITQHMERRFR